MKRYLATLVFIFTILTGTTSHAFLWLLSDEFPHLLNKVVVNGKEYTLSNREVIPNFYFVEWKDSEGKTVWAWTQQFDNNGRQVMLAAPTETELYVYSIGSSGITESVEMRAYWPRMENAPFKLERPEDIYYFDYARVRGFRDGEGKLVSGEVATYFLGRKTLQTIVKTQKLWVSRKSSSMRVFFDGYGKEGSYPWKWQEVRKDGDKIVYEVCKRCE